MRTETPWGAWDPLTPEQLVSIMHGCPAWWCIAGGFAIDAFCGRPGRRAHSDIDVSLLAREQLAAYSHLAGWELHAADPPGTLRPWRPGETLPEPVHDIWARRVGDDAWRFQLMLNPADSDDWIFRRDRRIRRPLAGLTWQSDGIRYVVPEVQLLFKSKQPRPKDQQDFDDALPLLAHAQRDWLRNAIEGTNILDSVPWGGYDAAASHAEGRDGVAAVDREPLRPGEPEGHCATRIGY